MQQWGRITVRGRNRQYVSFSRGFASTPYSVQISEYWPGIGTNNEATIVSKTAFGFTIANNDVSTLTYEYFATGR